MQHTDLIGNSCDDIAKHVNAPTSFVRKHAKEVQELKVTFRDFVKGLYPQNKSADSGNSKAVDSGNVEAANGCNVETADGTQRAVATPQLQIVPVHPSLADIDLSALSKRELVSVMRGYCSKIYCKCQ
jgi:hypothetical protein